MNPSTSAFAPASRGVLNPGRPATKLVTLAAILLPATVLYTGVLTWISINVYENPKELFEENSPSTYLSVIFLILCGVIAWALREDCRKIGDRFASFWTHTAVAFVLAGLDDGLRIHEFIDKTLHQVVGANPDHPITDHLDDVLVVIYGLWLLALGWKWRGRLLALPYLIWFGAAGAVTFAAMVVADFLNVVLWFEESLKLIAGAFFVIALFGARWDPAVAALRERKSAD